MKLLIYTRFIYNNFKDGCDFDYDLIHKLVTTHGKETTYNLLSPLTFHTDNCYQTHNLLYALFVYGYCDKYFETIELLLDIGFDVNMRSQYGYKLTLLMCAALYTNQEHGYKLAQIVLKRNPDITLKDTNGYTALDLAIQKNNEKVIELIMEYKNSAY